MQKTSTDMAELVMLMRKCHPTSGEITVLINVLSERVARSQNGMSEINRYEIINYLDVAADVATAADDIEQHERAA
jgi:hypothetical protein